MKPWVRLTLVTLTVGGGFAGFAATLQLLLKLDGHGLVSFALAAGFLALYAFVTASGLLFVRDQRQTVPLLVAFALQIPWVSSPIFGYRFAAGFQATIGFMGGALSAAFRLGSDWQCNLLQNRPWGIGVNLLALFITVLLAREIRYREATGQ
jgi:hypothetical protein